MKFSWKTIIGLIVLIASIIVGHISSVPAVDIVAIAGIIGGAVTSIYDILMKDQIKGWKCWLFVVTMVVGVAILTLAGVSKSTIETIIGGVIMLLDLIFGVAVLKISKE